MLFHIRGFAKSHSRMQDEGTTKALDSVWQYVPTYTKKSRSPKGSSAHFRCREFLFSLQWCEGALQDIRMRVEIGEESAQVTDRVTGTKRVR
jgi:hypothetical protein